MEDKRCLSESIHQSTQSVDAKSRKKPALVQGNIVVFHGIGITACKIQSFNFTPYQRKDPETEMAKNFKSKRLEGHTTILQVCSAHFPNVKRPFQQLWQHFNNFDKCK